MEPARRWRRAWGWDRLLSLGWLNTRMTDVAELTAAGAEAYSMLMAIAEADRPIPKTAINLTASRLQRAIREVEGRG